MQRDDESTQMGFDDYPPPQPPTLRDRYLRLTSAARLTFFLVAAFLLQFFVFLITRDDPVGTLLGLRVSPLGWKAIYQLFTYALVHSTGDPFHIVYNGIALYFVGNLLERNRGPKTMLSTFWCGVLVGGICFGAWEFARGGGGLPLYGASAGVYAVLVSGAVSAPNALVFFTIPLWVFASIYVGIDLIQFATSVRLAQDSSVSHIAHVGGAAAGLLLGWRGVHDSPYEKPSIKERIVTQIRETRERAREDRQRERSHRLDELLEKIHEQGIGALTEEEKRFLKEASAEIQSESRKK